MRRLLLTSVLLLGWMLVLVKSAGPNSPEQIHLSITSDSTQMVVQWVTWNATATSVVKYGLESGHYTSSASGNTTTYSTTGWPGFIHTVILTGLTPSTKYYYICGDTTSGSWSAEFSFYTMPPSGSEVHIAVYGDMGLNHESDQTVAVLTQAIASETYDLVMHMGDIAYTYSDGSTNQTRFDAFMTKIQPIAANAPYMVCPGNQEHPYEFQEYIYRWRMPGTESGSGTDLWYSYNVGPVHFVAMSTEHHFNEGSPQYNWLVSDLAAANANRAAQPWVIVFGHRPMYCSNSPYDGSWFTDCYVFAPAFRSLLESVFKKYSVDIYLAGHMHDAEYTYPLYDSQITTNGWNNPASTIHIISGYAGCREGFNGFDDEHKPAWSAWRQDTHYGFAHMTVYNATHLQFRYLYADNSSFYQDLWITRDAPPAPQYFNPAASHPVKPYSPSPFDESGMVDFVAGIGIGLGMEFGEIPECISDYYPLNYTFSLAFHYLDNGFDNFNISEIALGFQVLNAGLHDLAELMQDCGAVNGTEDFLEILIQFEKYGMGYVAEEEILKILTNFPTLESDIQQSIDFWNGGYYKQSGVYLGQVIGIMVKPDTMK